jgi:hypothetical protein
VERDFTSMPISNKLPVDAKEYDSEDWDRLKQARDMFIWSARDRLDQE